MRGDKILTGLILALLLSANVAAQGNSGLRLSGYGPLGLVQDDHPNITAIRDVSQRPQGGMDQRSWRRDSRLGLQAEYKVNAQVDVVGQLVYRDQLVSSFDHAVELAYLGFKPTAQLDLRIGRVGYDAFMMSDTRNVGYAYPWVRPFTEYYGWIPLFSVDGLDAAWVMPLDKALWRVKAQLGRSRAGIPLGTSQLDFRGDDVLNLTLSRQAGPWQIKAGYSRFTSRNEVSAGGLTDLRVGLGQIADASRSSLPAISAEASDLQRNLAFKNSQITYTTLGAAYNDGVWLVQGELARTTSENNIVPHGSMGYAVLGRHFGDWMPFIAYSATHPAKAVRRPGQDWQVIKQATTQQTALNVLNGTRMDQYTIALGTRWDFANQAALKLQWDVTRIKRQGYGLLFKDPAIKNRPDRMNQLTLTLDFVF